MFIFHLGVSSSLWLRPHISGSNASLGGSMQTGTAPATAVATDTFPINGTDYIEFYVGNAKQAAHYYRAAFGFELVAYRGPGDRDRDRASYLLQQDKIRFVLTTPIRPDGRRSREHVQGTAMVCGTSRSGSTMRATAFELAVERGAQPAREPTVLEGRARAKSSSLRFTPTATRSTASSSGGTTRACSCPASCRSTLVVSSPSPVGLKYVDHCVGNVELGEMNKWVEFYEDVLGFRNHSTFDDKEISTEYSALMSKVMSNGNGRIKFPINEPAAGQEEVADRRVPRVLRRPRRAAHRHRHRRHHRDGDGRCSAAAWSSCACPTTYYDTVLDRVGQDRRRPRHRCASSGFSSTATTRDTCCRSSRSRWRTGPTLFYEIIQRKGAKSFGAGKLQGAVRGDRARTGAARESVSKEPSGPVRPSTTRSDTIPRKRHIAFRKPDGGLYAEELMGHEGFTGTSSLLYHIYPPTTVKSVRRVREMSTRPTLTRRSTTGISSRRRSKKGGSPTLDRIPLLFNQDIAMLYVEPDKTDAHFYRNAQADELVYVSKGSGVLETVYGDLPYRRGRLPRHSSRHSAPIPDGPRAASRPSC